MSLWLVPPFSLHMHVILISRLEENHVPVSDNSTFSLTAMTNFWQQELPPHFRHEDVPAPLNNPSEKLARDPRHPDHRPVDWRNMLGGKTDDEKPTELDFARSEHDFLTTSNPSQLGVRRDWDVDSFIARITSLAAFRDGFYFAFSPSYLHRISQNLRVSLNGREVHKCKHMRLGSGKRTSREFHTYVVFPRMPVGHDRQVHLAQDVQARWLDRVVIPAITTHCSSDIRQHFPVSHADVLTKSWTKKERAPHSNDSSITITHHVQERYCGDIWNTMIFLASAADLPEFHDLFLVIVAHDLKYSTKSHNALTCRNDFLAYLRLCFHWSSNFFPPDDCWLDFAVEDTPVPSPGSLSVTLLRKTPCLQAWQTQFSCPMSTRPRYRSLNYKWALTRAAGSTSIELRSNNILRRHGHIAYNKAYNIHKTLFTTVIKGYQPFDNPQFEALAFSQDLMGRWYRANKRGSELTYTKKRQHLLHSYFATKKRITTALQDHQNGNYGVRQEYRIRWSLFAAMQLDSQEYKVTIGLKSFW